MLKYTNPTQGLLLPVNGECNRCVFANVSLTQSANVTLRFNARNFTKASVPLGAVPLPDTFLLTPVF